MREGEGRKSSLTMKDQVMNEKQESIELTSHMEDYLEAILVLQKEKGVVRVKDISDFLEVNKSSVNSALNALLDKKLIDHEHYGYIALTIEGEKLAKEIQNRHDVLHQFLVGVLGVEDKVASEDACRMEHVISADTIKKLTQFVKKYSKK